MRIRSSSAAANAVGSIDDLLMQILFCLPAKSLATFKLVSKHWKSLINTHHFLHDRAPVGLICPNHKTPIFEYIPLDVTNVDPPFWVLRFRADTLTHTYWIHQSCNGLLLCCWSESTSKKFPHVFPNNDDIHEYRHRCWSPMPVCCVYNPTTKCFVKIPSPTGASQAVLGVNLAFDPARSPGYKLVCVSGASMSAQNLVRIEMYSSELGTWRVCGEPFNATATFNYGVFWNGSVHWISYRLKKILYFNVYEEKHREVMLPATISGCYKTVEESVGYFGESRDHLHIVESCGGQKMLSLNVYEMKRDYSEWLIKYRVDVATTMTTNVGGVSVLSLVRVDKGKKKGSFLVLWAGDKKAVRYNLDCNTFEDISADIGNIRIDCALPRAFEYIESLASV